MESAANIPAVCWMQDLCSIRSATTVPRCGSEWLIMCALMNKWNKCHARCTYLQCEVHGFTGQVQSLCVRYDLRACWDQCMVGPLWSSHFRAGVCSCARQ
jgi:hypothetical protein